MFDATLSMRFFFFLRDRHFNFLYLRRLIPRCVQVIFINLRQNGKTYFAESPIPELI